MKRRFGALMMSVVQPRSVLQHLHQSLGSAGGDDGELLEAFVQHRDEAAFTRLLRRHGPMVWGVCRRLAGQECDAEDAFQAVFLILVRRAPCVQPRERLGAWLHGVADRTARKARQLAERRRAREKQVGEFPHPVVEPHIPNGDLHRVIDEELRRLPERLRLPVLLCDVEGRSHREVARQLGLPVGTLGHRLNAARDRLAQRLTRRGITLTLGGLAAVSVPRSLAAVTVRVAIGLADGRELASLVPPQIVALTEGVLTMSPIKFRATVALVLAIVLGGAGLRALHHSGLQAGENDPPNPSAVKPAEPSVDDPTFLRRISLDLRGTLPSSVELNYFVEDKDPGKRRKVVGWMLDSADGRANDKPGQQSPLNAGESERAMEEARRWLEQQQLLESLQKLLEEQQKKSSGDGRSTSNQLWDDFRQAYELLQRQHPDSEATDPYSKAVDGHFRPKFTKELRGSDPSADPSKGQEGLYKLSVRPVPNPNEGGDAEFLRRIMFELAGRSPSTIERNYFLADKDAKKREKLVNWLLKDNPAAAKRWQQRMTSTAPKMSVRYDKLLNELLAQSRTDEQILEALTLATLARFPTDAERAFVATHLHGRSDRRAAWTDVLHALLHTPEHRGFIQSLQSPK